MAVIIFGSWLIVAAVLSCQQYAAQRVGGHVTWANYLLCMLWPAMLFILIAVFIYSFIETTKGNR